jgi:TonB family protein
MMSKKPFQYAVIGHLAFLFIVLSSWNFQRNKPIEFTDDVPIIQVQAISEDQLPPMQPIIEPEPLSPLPEPPAPEIKQEPEPMVVPEPEPEPAPQPPPPPAQEIPKPPEPKPVKKVEPPPPKPAPDLAAETEKKKKKEKPIQLADALKNLLKPEPVTKPKVETPPPKPKPKPKKEKDNKVALQALAKQSMQEAKAQEALRRKEAAQAATLAKAKQVADRAAASARSAELAAEKDRLIASIQRRIRGQWINQMNQHQDLTTTLKIQLDEGGEIVMIDVLESSGDETFDRQAKLAAQKSSPFPMPSDPSLAREFRTLVLPFQNG